MGSSSQILVSVCFVSLFSWLSRFLLFKRKKNIQWKQGREQGVFFDKGESERENEKSIEKAVAVAVAVAAAEISPPNCYLPDVLIEDILSEVAVTDLVRYRCVSKSCCALISDLYFAKKHLQLSIKNNTNVGLIVQGKSHRSWIRVDLDDDVRVNHYDPIIRFGVHHCRCKSSYYTGHIYDMVVGSCHGLICLSSKDNHVAIWNPSTGKSHQLPLMPIQFGFDPKGLLIKDSSPRSRIVYGFGYDRDSDDYKVMGLEQAHCTRYGNLVHFCTLVWVYSLKTTLWTRSSSYFPSKHETFTARSGVFASTGNALHWIMERENFNWNDDEQYCIGALDLGGVNGYREVQKPDCKFFHNTTNDVLIDLGVLKGCLCVCSGCEASSSTDIWVMKEYGVKESWTRLISFGATIPGFYTRKRPLAYSRCGDNVVLHDCSNFRLIWYDLKTKIVKNVELLRSNLDYIDVAEACVHSLVDPANC